MEVDLDGNRALLHALLEDDRVGVSRAEILRYLFQLRRKDVHGDDFVWLDLFRNELPRRLGVVDSIEEEKIDGRPLKGIVVQVSFALIDGRIAHMEKTRASQLDDKGQVFHG